MREQESKYDDAIAVTREISWVGFFDDKARLHCNPYLLIDGDEGVLFDPGSIPHFPVVMRKVIDLINPGQISTVVISHQDPDVCGNLAVLEDVIDRPDLRVVAHGRTVRFARHYGINASFVAAEDLDFLLRLESGRELRMLHMPYAHAPGALVTYDPRSRSLFTGDIFGALEKDWSLFAAGDFLEAIGAFHCEYMPNNQVLRSCIRRLEGLELDRVLPQHGAILEGEQVRAAMAFLADLRCGTDLDGEQDRG